MKERELERGKEKEKEREEKEKEKEKEKERDKSRRRFVDITHPQLLMLWDTNIEHTRPCLCTYLEVEHLIVVCETTQG